MLVPWLAGYDEESEEEDLHEQTADDDMFTPPNRLEATTGHDTTTYPLLSIMNDKPSRQHMFASRTS